MTHAHSRLSSDVCLFSICRAMYARSRLLERRLWWDVELDETSHQNETIHQSWRKRLIKLDESDSSNLTRKDVISSNLTKASSYQTWRKRHFIKLDEKIISSNLRSSSSQTFWKKRQSLYFLMSDLMQRHMMWET
jgi:hypothetical protein